MYARHSSNSQIDYPWPTLPVPDLPASSDSQKSILSPTPIPVRPYLWLLGVSPPRPCFPTSQPSVCPLFQVTSAQLITHPALDLFPAPSSPVPRPVDPYLLLLNSLVTCGFILSCTVPSPNISCVVQHLGPKRPLHQLSSQPRTVASSCTGPWLPPAPDRGFLLHRTVASSCTGPWLPPAPDRGFLLHWTVASSCSPALSTRLPPPRDGSIEERLVT